MGFLAAIAFAVAASLLLPAPALAHVPVLEPSARSDRIGTPEHPYPGATEIEGPDASRAVYGYLARDERFDAYRFKVTRKVTTTIGVLVPVSEGSDRFRPTVSVVLQNRVLADIRDPGQARRVFFEPFSLMRLYQGPEQAVTFEPGPEYVLLVEPGAGSRRVGRYVIAFSGAEEFSPGDWGRTFIDLPRIWLGLYGQGEPNIVPVIVLLVVLVAVGVVVDTLRRRRARLRRDALQRRR